MRLDLLNRLIEAHKLSSDELTAEKIETYVDAVNQWREQVLDTTAKLDKPLTHEEILAVNQIELYSTELIERLSLFLKQLQAEQQQLVKQKQVRSAYNKAW